MKAEIILVLIVHMFKSQYPENIGIYNGNQDPLLPHTVKIEKQLEKSVDELQMMLDNNRSTTNLDVDVHSSIDMTVIDKMLEET